MYIASLRYFSEYIEDVDFNLCALGLYLGKHHIAYTLTENNRVVCFEKYNLGNSMQDVLGDFINENRWLLQSYQSVAVAVNSPEIHISPMHIDANDDLLDPLFGKDGNAVVHNLYIQKHQLKVSYRVPQSVEEVLQASFPTAGIKHYAGLVVAAHQNFNGVNITLHCLDEYYTIVIFHGNKLALAHTVEAVSNEKLSYLLLSYCQMLGFDVNNVLLALSGWITESSALYAELAKYFIHINLQVAPNFVCDKVEHEAQYFNTFDIINNS